ncbi:hypothetical protein ACM66B_000442 [Microbotryomycetes sp. NB124-2]
MQLTVDPTRNVALLGLPLELLTYLLSFLDLESLLDLRLTNNFLNTVILNSLLPLHLQNAAGSSVASVKHRVSTLPLAKQCLWIDKVARNWTSWRDVRAQSLNGVSNGEWTQRCMPIVRLWNGSGVSGDLNRVVIARGHELDFVQVMNDDKHTRNEFVPLESLVRDATAIRGVKQVNKPSNVAMSDITGLCPVSRTELVISRVSGHVQKVRVNEPTWTGSHWYPGSLVETARYNVVPAGSAAVQHATTIQSMHASGNILASAYALRLKPPYHSSSRRRRLLSSRATAATAAVPRDIVSLGAALASKAIEQKYGVSISSVNSPWHDARQVKLPTDLGKPWCVLLSSEQASNRWLAIGSTSLKPLSLFSIDQTGSTDFNHSPRRLGPILTRKTSIYSICIPQVSSTLLNPFNTLIATYYDSTTRVFDLRVKDDNSSMVMELRDPWSDDAGYSVTTCGSQGAYVACGTSRNATVRVFDVRQHQRQFAEFDSYEGALQRRGIGGGKTMFLPGKDRSPVYSLAGEYSRLWAVTDRRTSVVDVDSTGLTRWESTARRRQDTSSERRRGGDHDGEWDEAVWFYEHDRGGE